VRRACRVVWWVIPAALLTGIAVARGAASADPLAAAGTITVRVADAGGKAVGAAHVGLFEAKRGGRAVLDVGGAAWTDGDAADAGADGLAGGTGGGVPRERPKPIQTATTDASGRATFTGVAAGSYVVVGHLKGDGIGRARVTVAGGGGGTSATLTLRPRAR
jgi:hypothetical protein